MNSSKISGKAGQNNLQNLSGNNPHILLDKLNMRRSTPDSEALASSDDEGERQVPPPHQKATRRASWLTESVPSTSQPRKSSFASSTMSPTASHPSTPSADSANWGSHSQTTGGVRGATATNSFPWSSGIWNSESRSQPPSRLAAEVLPSPTSINPPGSSGNGFFGNDLTSSHKENASNTTIPFAIPLHPTPKTYRSQSYSVGQLDHESSTSSINTTGPGTVGGRGRTLQHSGLQHRPSRPSMLSEMSNDGGLGKLKEVEDDDDESAGSSSHGNTQQSKEAKTIELLARENAILRQQQYNSRIRPRSSTSNAFGMNSSYMQEPLHEESDYAIDELEEISELQGIPPKAVLGRRMSEYGLGGTQRVPSYSTIENRKLENVKKGYWATSLGFGGADEMPQSRRHSFAVDMPARHGSISSTGDALSAHENALQEALSPSQGRFGEKPGYSMNDHGEQSLDSITRRPSLYDQKKLGQILEEASMQASYSHDRNAAANYFGGSATLPRNAESYVATNFPSPYPFANQTQYGSGRPPSPHRSLYGVPQPRHNQLLYIVLFKCSRADVFYVQEGTGLSVKPGDLVIVEADRGTDLGTVARDNVDWATAKELKEHYAEEHYKWLMMYSQGAAATSDGSGAGLMAASNGLQGSAVGGMGPPSQHGMQEPNPGEIKPKIIKRLAQNHEIQALRDKEGNEAKAKRVCMQKVKEHGLHMEILDAEFQMDWKKLTFYYFADAYINFNSLVTDLFKVYKTRIWMSAINPASFASPSLGLQAPSGVGPGAIGASRSQAERRPPQTAETAYNLPVNGRGFSYGDSFADRQNTLAAGGFQQASPYGYGYSPFGAPRNVPVSPANYAGLAPFGAFPTSTDYQGPGRFPSPHGSTQAHDSDFARSPNTLNMPNEAWMTTFQSLSMNSR